MGSLSPPDDRMPSRRLGWKFYAAALAPIGLFVLGFINNLTGGTISESSLLGGVLWTIPPSALVSGCLVGSRHEGPKGWLFGMLTFFGIVILYVGIAFAGCVLLAEGVRRNGS